MGTKVCGSQLTSLCSATIRCSVQSRITSLHERLALSRIKEESVHVAEGKCPHSTTGGIKGTSAGSMDAAEVFDGTKDDGEGSSLVYSTGTPQRLDTEPLSAQASKTDANSSKLPSI